MGSGGRGGVHAAGLAAEPDVVRTVTLSKALGTQGGAVLGATEQSHGEELYGPAEGLHATYRMIHMPTAAQLRDRGFELSTVSAVL